MGLYVAIGGATQARIDVRIDAHHDIPARKLAPLPQHDKDLPLPLVPVVDVLLDALSRVPDEGAVPRTHDLQVRKLTQPFQAVHVVEQVAHRRGALAENGITAEENALFLQV